MQLLSPGNPPAPAAADYVPHLSRPDLSVGTYSIPAGGIDLQSPHTEDEVYVCTGGRATLWTPGGSAAMSLGAVAFVPAGEEHRFVDVSEDFTVVVAFGPAEGSRRSPGFETDLALLGDAREVEAATVRRDGTPSWVPIWTVRVGDGLYARSFHGESAVWLRRAEESGALRLRLDGAEHEVAVSRVGVMLRTELDAEYARKYVGEDAQYVPAMVSDAVAATTVRLTLR